MFPFSAWFFSLPQTGKALVDDCGLMLQMQWRKNSPEREKFKFRLPSVAQKRLLLLQNVSALEPTLHAGLLPKTTFKLTKLPSLCCHEVDIFCCC